MQTKYIKIGPGLGREEATLQIVLKIAEGAIKMQIPMVVDGVIDTTYL